MYLVSGALPLVAWRRLLYYVVDECTMIPDP